MSIIEIKRRSFHQKLLAELITVDEAGVTSIADVASEPSKLISSTALQMLGTLTKTSKNLGKRLEEFSKISAKPISKKHFFRFTTQKRVAMRSTKECRLTNFHNTCIWLR